jgi:ribonuclease BN (tRNA processing enzyme)
MSLNPEIELTVLGSGTCALQLHRSMSGYALRNKDFFVLLDCGNGVLRRCLEAGLRPFEIDAILISHLHVDHSADLVPLLWALKYAPEVNRSKPLQFFGPPGLQEFFKRLPSIYGSWIENFSFSLIVRDVRQEEFVVGPWRVKTLPMQHGNKANGYRLQSGSKVIAYSGDTGECAEVMSLGKNADLLILECSFADDHGAQNHLHAAQAARLGRRAECRKLLLTHFYPECDQKDILAICRKEFSGSIELAADLMRLIL